MDYEETNWRKWGIFVLYTTTSKLFERYIWKKHILLNDLECSWRLSFFYIRSYILIAIQIFLWESNKDHRDYLYTYISAVYNKYFINNKMFWKTVNIIIKFLHGNFNINKINTVQYEIQITTMKKEKIKKLSKMFEYYMYMYNI